MHGMCHVHVGKFFPEQRFLWHVKIIMKQMKSPLFVELVVRIVLLVIFW